jgi:hypothetical protein
MEARCFIRSLALTPHVGAPWSNLDFEPEHTRRLAGLHDDAGVLVAGVLRVNVTGERVVRQMNLQNRNGCHPPEGKRHYKNRSAILDPEH